MPLTLEDFLADVAAVYIGAATDGAFGSGRLIAPGLILTAGHVVDYPKREAPTRTGWKIPQEHRSDPHTN
jgi:V8-like Glu-specific endopeptidase